LFFKKKAIQSVKTGINFFCNSKKRPIDAGIKLLSNRKNPLLGSKLKKIPKNCGINPTWPLNGGIIWTVNSD